MSNSDDETGALQPEAGPELQAASEPARGVNADKALAKLTEMQRAFVLAYVGEAKGDQRQAAIVAGYAADSASVTACKLLANAKVQTALRRLVLPGGARARQRTASQMTQLADAIDRDPEVAYAPTTSPKRSDAIAWLESAYRGQVTETRTTKFGEPYEAVPPLAPRVRALEVLAKLEGWAPAEMGSKTNPLHVVAGEVDPSTLTDEQLQARLAELEAQRLERPS